MILFIFQAWMMLNFFSCDYQIDSGYIRIPNIYRLFIKGYLRFSREKPHSNDEKKNYYLWMEIEFSYGRISVLKFYPIVILFWVEENERGKKKRKKGSKRKHAFKWWNYEIFKISCNSSVNVTANLFHMNAILELNMW